MTLNYKKKVSFQLGSIRMTETALAQNYLFYKNLYEKFGEHFKNEQSTAK